MLIIRPRRDWPGRAHALAIVWDPSRHDKRPLRARGAPSIIEDVDGQADGVGASMLARDTDAALRPSRLERSEREDPKGSEAIPGRTRQRSVEDHALDRLIAFLATAGEAVEIVCRPDQARSDRPCVDAELRVGGRLVGVEITQSIWNARAHVEIGRLTQAVEALVRAQPLRWPTGYVAVNAHFRALPAGRELRLAESILAREIAEGISTLDPDPSARRETAIDTVVAFVRRLRLIQLPGGRSGFGWITGSDEWGGRIGPEATAFIDHLLATKPAQTARYKEAWVIIVNRDGLVGPADVAEALAERSTEVPTNWTRVWVLPATDEVSVALAWPAALR